MPTPEAGKGLFETYISHQTLLEAEAAGLWVTPNQENITYRLTPTLTDPASPTEILPQFMHISISDGDPIAYVSCMQPDGTYIKQPLSEQYIDHVVEMASLAKKLSPDHPLTEAVRQIAFALVKKDLKTREAEAKKYNILF